MVLLSIIIVNVKGSEYLPKLIESIMNSSFSDFEVIVVDIKEGDIIHQKIKYVVIEKDLGLSYCRNVGVNSSSGEYILFLDNDSEVFSNTLQHLMDFMLKNEEKIVQPLLIRDDNAIDAAGGLIDELGYSKELHRGEKPERVTDVTQVLYAKGAAFALSRKTFEKVGYFDEEYFYGYDESDYCLNAWKKGVPVYVYPSSIVRHYEHGSFKGNALSKSRRLTYFLESRRLYFVFKNFKLRMLFKTTLPILIYFSGSVIRDALNKERRGLVRVRITAFVWFLGKFPKIAMYRMKRKEITYDEYYLISRGLIIKHGVTRES
ncbi:glycosyl transferase [Sulfolobales archaeon HS-7]|nr:glycosyl transferase [Sulfolobales archaeon HS-7]